MGKRLAYDTTFNYGCGIDSTSEQARGDAVEYSKPSSPEGLAGAVVEYETQIVTSQKELQNSLGISAAMSLKYGFGAAGVDARVKYTSEKSMSETSVAAVVHVKVANPVLMIKEEKLKDDARELYIASAERFAEAYGDSYVNGFITGGELYGVVMLYTRTTEEQESMKMDLNAKMRTGLTELKLDVSVVKAMNELESKTERSVSVYTIGPTLDPAPESPAELVAAAQKFAGLVQASGKAMPFQVDLMEYKHLGLPEGANPFDLQNKNDVISFAAGLKSQTVTRLRTIGKIREAIKKDPTAYPDANDENLSIEEGKALNLLDKIHTRVSECFNDYRKCNFVRADLVLPGWTPPMPRPGFAPGEQTSPISEKYKLCSFLGSEKPGEDEKQSIDGVGKYQLFENGGIYWHPDIGAYSVQSPIHEHYIEKGSERGELGYPADDQKWHDVKVYSVFQKGVIVHNRETDAIKTYIYPADGQAYPHWLEGVLKAPGL
jgi:hypothetical protein